MSTIRRMLPTVLLAALATPLALAAQTDTSTPRDPQPRSGDEVGWYTVRPGDTLRGITQRYLGTESLWRENWRLNPDVANPDFLPIGKQLRVILNRQLPPRAARIVQVSRRVEKKPQPNPWTDARQGDLLREADGVHTFEQSSSEIEFDDGTRLTMTEQSLIFLRRVGKTLTGVSQETIEIVEGQADLVSRPEKPGSSEIEIVIGDTTARPRPTAAGVAEGRLRRTEGAAQLMVYEGVSEVAAAGQSVEVPRGMGTSVEQGKAPSPPEKLLSAPRPTPAMDRWPFANPRLSWRAVGGASSYVVEVCGDADCGELLERAEALEETAWQAGVLPTGEHFWRVTAVAPSGLDGYPSRPRPLTILNPRPDLEPPAVAVRVEGPGRAFEDGRVQLSPGGSLSLEGQDDVSGVEEIRFRWNDGPWTAWSGQRLTPPTGEDGQRLEVQATDRVGRVSRNWAVTVESAPPALEPPVPERAESEK
ncbi:MAG: FecR domain-containing protein [Acidobacteriota bacterium]